jgi:hypothetical protein
MEIHIYTLFNLKFHSILWKNGGHFWNQRIKYL